MSRNKQALMALLLAVSIAGCSGAPVKEERPLILSMADEAASSGISAYTEGDFDKAILRFKESLRMNRAVDNRQGELVDLINIGRASVELGGLKDAVSYLNEALSLAALLKDDKALSDAHATLGKAYYLAGDADTALLHLDKSIAVDIGCPERSGPAKSLKGLIYTASGRKDEARMLLKEALDIASSAKDASGTANAMRGLADLDAASGNLKDAYAYLEKAYDADRSLGLSERIAIDLEKMADVRVAEGRTSEGAFLYERAYLVNLSGGHARLAISAIDKLIKAYDDMGEAQKARFYLSVKEAIVSGNKPAEGMGR